MAVDGHLAFQDHLEGLQLVVAGGRLGVRLSGRDGFLVFVPLGLVLAGVGEGLAGDVGRAEPGGGRFALPAVEPLGILAQGHLELRPDALDQQLVERPGVLQLDDGVDRAEDVGAAVHGLDRGDPAGQRRHDRRVVGDEDVLHPEMGGRGVGRLVDVAAVDGDMRVGVDQPGQDEAAGDVDDLQAGRHGDVPAEGGDLALLDDHRSVLDDAAGDGQDGAAPQGDVLGRERRGEE